jgi:hypothetical protein
MMRYTVQYKTYYDSHRLAMTAIFAGRSKISKESESVTGCGAFVLQKQWKPLQRRDLETKWRKES